MAGWPKKQPRVERGARQEGKQVGQDGRCPEEEEFRATPADGVLDPNRKGDPEGEHATQEENHQASSGPATHTLCCLCLAQQLTSS